jgi:tRNA-splicing ligase RtcB
MHENEEGLKMIVTTDGGLRVPIKAWLPSWSNMEEGCLAQASNLARLPFAYKHVAIMPDCHQGYGMPIGGVLAAKGVIIPNAVGVDIGCGMAFKHTNIPANLLRDTQTGSGSLAQLIVGQIMRNVPVGFAHHTTKQASKALDEFAELVAPYLPETPLDDEVDAGYFQIGTLGGGNHFIELQEDEQGFLGVMLHSGSRNFGLKIAKFYNEKAKALNAKWHTSVPPEYDLAFLPVDSDEGQQYITWMKLALDFAAENRAAMLQAVVAIVENAVEKHTDYLVDENTERAEINCHHNYAAIEHHGNEDVWVHRKGAIRARAGEIGIIPGAMGSYSYIVKGLGNPESFFSCSHGAGRRMGRKEATRQFTVQEVMEDFKAQNIVLGKSKKDDATEEYRLAYKDIDAVIANETDLVEPTLRLKTVAVVKG